MNRKIIRITIKSQIDNDEVAIISKGIADFLKMKKIKSEVYDDSNCLLIKNR